MEKLAIHGGESAIDLKMPHYIWPIIDKSDVIAVTRQLQETVSIYDNSGVIKEFEEKWKDLHGADFALLTNSGTSALFSLFVGIGLKESDEIICPDYTFFATITPVLTLGAVPVFCDCDENGNINPEYIEGLITRKTKAVVITHMWGIPCDMDKIVAVCKQYHLHLIEDCSHAHGAKYKGQLVGTFGIGAAWSLQGQKIITGGEGGILTASSEDVYYRALLLGHYNKRCRQEIPQDHPLYAYALTGFGHKFRAHPLAVSLAMNQLSKLDCFLMVKRKYARFLIKELEGFPFLQLPQCNDGDPSWYAFVMRFDPQKSNGFTRQEFIEMLHSEGLKEVEIPNSTCPLADLPLFNTDDRLDLPWEISRNSQSKQSFVNSGLFYSQAIKIPVWAREEDKIIVEKYVKGIKKVSQYILDFKA